MPITNQKALDALRALSEGGSAGLSSYKQAQNNEAASRTSALQGALGGPDVANAAAQAQAQYAPKVNTTGLGVGDLGAAADSYLSRAANKLAAQQYEDTQNLSLQAETLRRSQVSEKDRNLMMAGASDAYAAQQRDQANADATRGAEKVTGLGGVEQERARLVQAAQDAQKQASMLAPLMASGNTSPESVANQQAVMDQLKTSNEALAGFDQGIQGRFQQGASMLGRDTKGLEDQYKIAQETGNFQGYNDLVNFLGQEAQQAGARNVQARNAAIDTGEQQRMRELAPAFGIDPLVAAGMFRENEGQDLGRVQQRGQEESYRETGNLPGQSDEKATAAAQAQALGFEDPTEYEALIKKPGLGPENIAATKDSEEWKQLEAAAQTIKAGGIASLSPAGVTLGNDIESWKSLLTTAVAGATNADGTPWSDKQKAAFRDMAEAYFTPGMKKMFEGSE